MINLLFPQRQRFASDTATYRTQFLEGRSLLEIMGFPTASKIDVNESSALTYSAVWAATRLIAGTGGWLPLNLYQRVSYRENRVAWEDPRDDLVFQRPNKEMDSMPFRAMCFMQQVNGGNAYAAIERTRADFPFALWPIHPSRVTRARDQDGDIVYLVTNNTGTPDTIYAKDMIHVPSMMTLNGIDGLGVIRHARESIGMGLVTERQGAAHFGSGGIPSIVVLHKQKFNEPGRTAFRKEWHEIHGGSGETSKSNLAILDQDAQIQTLTLSPEDNQYLSTREHNVEEIARWYGVPPHMIGDLRRATFSNIEAQGIAFVVYSMIPWLKLWEQQLATKLLTDEERPRMFFEFNVTALLRGDSAARAAYLMAMVNNGMMNRNEARRLENLPPYDGGDEFFLQGAMVPVRSLLAAADAATKAAESAPVDAEPEDEPTDSKSKLPTDEERAAWAIEWEKSARVVDSCREQALRAAARAMLVGTIGRMIRKEATAARRAAGKPSEFLRWLDEFYDDKHAATYREAVGPVCEALVALGMIVRADQLAESEIGISKRQLLELSGTCSAADLLAKVETQVAAWEQSRAAEVANAVFCGGPGSGPQGGRNPRVKEQKPSAKAERAKAAHVLVDSRIQRYSEEHNEPQLAKKLGGKSEPDNKAYDVAIANDKGKTEHGVELKTMVSNSNDKITMKGSAQDRKIAFEKEHNATFHTVVYDDRKVYNAKGEGKHGSDLDRQILYRRGGGSFRTGTMHKVKDHAELKRLINSKDSDLPPAARATKQWKERQSAAGVKSR